MDKERKNPVSWLLDKLKPPHPLVEAPHIDPELQFAMKSNGFSLTYDGVWESDDFFKEKFRKETCHYGLFGPYASTLDYSLSGDEIAGILNQPPVLEVIRKFREFEPDEAWKIALRLGIPPRLSIKDSPITTPEIAWQVKFIAKLAGWGGRKSGEAVASAMALNLFSEKHFIPNYKLEEDVYDMAEAITEDNTNLQEAEDLGISQAVRLWRFIKKVQARGSNEGGVIPSPDISPYREAFKDFPTVGVEYHIPADAETFSNFWQRVALLNMSQYQRETLIPLSRNDQGLIEIRMNPSIYPIATATWNLMRLLLPELNQHYFTITVNRRDNDFSNKSDQHTISLLQSLSSLCYAAHLKEVPTIKASNDPKLGEWYTGRTVRNVEGIFKLVGGVDKSGQLNLYTGFERRITTPRQALEIPSQNIQFLFDDMNDYILRNPEFRNVTNTGQKIISLLSP